METHDALINNRNLPLEQFTTLVFCVVSVYYDYSDSLSIIKKLKNLIQNLETLDTPIENLNHVKGELIAYTKFKDFEKKHELKHDIYGKPRY
jgi:hypothetical protein